MNQKGTTMIGLAAVVLAALGALAISAQDEFALKVPDGLPFSEFRAYAGSEVVSINQNGTLMAATLANPVMTKAFPDGAKMAKIDWSPKKMETFPFTTVRGTQHDVERARAEGLAAWQQVYSVLTHPRCINCHTATDHPDQGDDRHRHAFNVVRGPDGKGVPGLNCMTCHQSSNSNTGVPGAPGWHLAPLSMKWQDLNGQIFSSAQVCKSLIDRSKNGNLGGSGLLKHHNEAPLVLWAFDPGRLPYGNAFSPPPLTHEEFVTATRIWVEAGTPCPGGAAAVKSVTP
jgi:mono/diheme cytochrome c family protein